MGTKPSPNETPKVRVVVSDEFGQHGISMRAGVIWAYNFCDMDIYDKIDISEEVLIVPYWKDSLQYAKDHPSVELMLRSTTQLSYQTIEDVKPLYPRVQVLFPMGSNKFIQLME